MLEEPDDDENDMLDMAFGLTDTSRLGCQVSTGLQDSSVLYRVAELMGVLLVIGEDEKRS